MLQMGHSRTRAREGALCATSRDHCFYKFDTRARARAREPDTRAVAARRPLSAGRRPLYAFPFRDRFRLRSRSRGMKP